MNILKIINDQSKIVNHEDSHEVGNEYIHSEGGKDQYFKLPNPQAPILDTEKTIKQMYIGLNSSPPKSRTSPNLTALTFDKVLIEALKNKCPIQRDIDNDYALKDNFVRIRITETLHSFLILTAIGSGLLADEYKYTIEGRRNEKYETVSLLIVSICSLLSSINITLIIVMTTVFRYFIRLNLKIERGFLIRRKCIQTKKIILLVTEVILALLHPNLLTNNVYFTTNSIGYLVQVKYKLNDYLLIILICRIYNLAYFFIVISQYHSPKSERVAYTVGLKPSTTFAIKCLFETFPFLFVTISILLVMFPLGFIMRIVEGPAFVKNDSSLYYQNDFRLISNCLWMICVTMTTVGYGDYIPLTVLGRIIAVFASITGSILISLIVIALQRAFLLNQNEDKAVTEKNKKEAEEDVEKVTLKFLLYNYRYRRIAQILENASFLPQSFKKIMKTAKGLNKNLEKQMSMKISLKQTVHNYHNMYNVITEPDMINMQIIDLIETKDGLEKSNDVLQREITDIRACIKRIRQEVERKF